MSLGRGADVAGARLGGGDGLAGGAGGTGHGVLSVAGHGAVAGRGRRPGVLLLAPQEDHDAPRRDGEGGEQPRPAPRTPSRRRPLALDLLGGGGRLLLELARASCRPSCAPSWPSCGPCGRTSPRWRPARRGGPPARCARCRPRRPGSPGRCPAPGPTARGPRPPAGWRRPTAAVCAASSRGTTSSCSAFCAAFCAASTRGGRGRRRPGRRPRRATAGRRPSRAPRRAGRSARGRASTPRAPIASRAASTRGAMASRAEATAGAAAARRRRPWGRPARPPSGRPRVLGRRPPGRPRPGGRVARPRDGRPRWPPPRCGRSPPGARRR